MFRLIKKKDEELGVSTGRRTVLDLGLSTPPRPKRRAPTRPHAVHPEGGSLGDILAPVLEGQDREEHRDRHLQRLSFFNRQLAHLTSFLQVTPNVPMAPGARLALESVVSAVADLDHFLAAECALSESPASPSGASLDEAGLGELVVDGELADPETLKAIELDLLGMRDEVVTIHAELAEDRAWLELLRGGEEGTAEELRSQITETYDRANDLLRECQDTLSRVPLHDDRLVDDLVAAEPEEVVDDVEPFALDLDQPPPPPARLVYDEEEAFSLGDALAQVAVPPRKAAAPSVAPPPAPRPAAVAPPPPPDDEDAFSLGDVLAQVPVAAPKVAAPTASPPPPSPAAPPPRRPEEVGFSFGEAEAPFPGRPEPARAAEPALPPPAPTPAEKEPAPPEKEPAPEAPAPGADAEQELRRLQQFFNDHSPAGSLTEAYDGEFRSRISELLRAAALTTSLSDNALELRLRQLKSTLGLRKKLNNRMTLPELLGFFR